MPKNTRLRQLRKARTLTQMDLARLAGISQQALSKFENGQLVPSFDVQARLAAILGTTPDVLWPGADARRDDLPERKAVNQ